MSNRWVPRSDSPWSSERDRARRKRGEPSGSGSSRWTGGTSKPSSEPETPADPPETAPERPSTERIDRLTAGTGSSSRRSRFRRDQDEPPAPASDGDGDESDPPSALPDLPGSSGSGGSPGGTRMIILGGLLFLAMAAIFILPRMLGDDGSDTGTTPTPELIQTPTPRPDTEGQEVAAAPTQAATDAEYVVCIDPGHGGWDTGRVREANSRAPAMMEKEITLGMGWMLKDILESEGIGVVMTRESGLAVNVFNEDINGDGETLQDSQQAGDRDELQARINICNAAEADILVSLHLNGFDDPTARGYEILYTRAPFREFGDFSADLATYIYREMGAAYDTVGFDTLPRGTLPDDELDAETHQYGVERHLFMTGPAIENADFTLVPSAMPGVVIEALFITNDDDASFIASEDNQRLLARAYADGILTYFEQHPDGP